jgi:hypothetical protein
VLLIKTNAFCWNNNCVIINMHGKTTLKTSGLHLTLSSIQLGFTIVLRLCRLIHGASCFECDGTILYFLNPTPSFLSSLCLRKEGLRNIRISASMQYVVIEAYGYNGRQALRLVPEKCVIVSRRTFFFCILLGSACGIVLGALYSCLHLKLYMNVYSAHQDKGERKVIKMLHPRRLPRVLWQAFKFQNLGSTIATLKEKGLHNQRYRNNGNHSK